MIILQLLRHLRLSMKGHHCMKAYFYTMIWYYHFYSTRCGCSYAIRFHHYKLLIRQHSIVQFRIFLCGQNKIAKKTYYILWYGIAIVDKRSRREHRSHHKYSQEARRGPKVHTNVYGRSEFSQQSSIHRLCDNPRKFPLSNNKKVLFFLH